MSDVSYETVNQANVGADHAFDVEKIRADFPILHRSVHGHPLVFLDNAASTQKPSAVIDTVRHYYEAENANIHRGVYYLSELATRKYEATRGTIQKFINAAAPREIIFTGGTTDSINLVASGFGRTMISPGDEIIISVMEHHSNIVPWQMMAEQTGAVLRVVPIDAHGDLRMDDYASMFSAKTRLVSLVYISNSLGTVNPVAEIIETAHRHHVPVLLDAAQAVAHQPIDVQALDCDFLAFSGHKIFGPTGIGVLYGKSEWLEKLSPWRGGGDMIERVTFEKTTYAELPHRLEAGTPNIAGVIGLGAAIDYVQKVGLDAIAAHETAVLAYGLERLQKIPTLRFIGTARRRSGAISFVIEGIHPHDVGTWVDRAGVAVRAGHHCTQPVMDFFGIAGTSRASIALYNQKSDFDRLAESLEEMIKVFT